MSLQGVVAEEARNALVCAEKEARRLGHYYIGTEHMLLGLLVQPHTLAVRILIQAGLSPIEVRVMVEMLMAPSIKSSEGLMLTTTDRSQRAIQLALEESRRFPNRLVAPEHLLIGLLREEKESSVGVLISLEPNPGAIEEVFALVNNTLSSSQEVVFPMRFEEI